MEFSVLMSIYQKEKAEYFKMALESVINQTKQPSEIVVVKDGILTKELNEVSEEYENKYKDLFKFIQLKRNQGLGKALQVGVENCSYSIIARMDTDDIAKPERFEKQIKEFEHDPNLVILGSAIEEFSISPEKIDTIRTVPLHNEEIYTYAKKRNPFNHMTVMFRREAVLNVGNYQPFYLNEDYFLWFKLLKKGYKAKNLSESLVYVRVDRGMFKRRGGTKYFAQEIRLQNIFYKYNFINGFEYFRNLWIRAVARIIPNNTRAFLYKKYLRK